MNYAEIKYCDIADGPGVRTSLFVSGCSHHCKGCFNEIAHDFNAGMPFDDEVKARILESLSPYYVAGLTVLGGEPMEPENQAGLLPFLQRAKETYPDKTIWIYTGDLYEDLLDAQSKRHTDATEPLLGLIDVLVDGPFIEAKKDISLQFRGSSNQRLIDIQKTRKQRSIVLWEDPRDFDMLASRA